MRNNFLKRQSIWVCILLAGLIITSVYAFQTKSLMKAGNNMPLLNYSQADVPDTSTLSLTGFNFGFETVSIPTELPSGWGRWGSPSYNFVLDSSVKYSGKYALRIESASEEFVQGEFGCPRLSIPVDFKGNTVTVKAFMKLEGVEKPIGLLLRIDGDRNETLQFNNMQQKGIVGTHDWKEYSVTLPLPENAKTILIGAIHSGKGKLWVDDFQVIIKHEIDFNLGFENVSDVNGLPDEWFKWGTPSYNIQVDSVIKHTGKYALRVEPKDGTNTEGFGCPARTILANYEGEKITLKAFMKTEGVEQPIGLMLRIDGNANEVLQFDNMQQKGIKGSGAWEEYAVTLPLPEKAQNIHIGAILSGKGKLWIDDFQVLIDDEDISKAKAKPKKTYKADEDTEFDRGSKITIDACTPQMLVNLELLGRIWGFLKYYHPAVSTGDYNWDAELFRIMHSIINTTNTNERDIIFIKWIEHLGKTTPAKNTKTTNVEMKMQPDFAWMDNLALDKVLLSKLKEIIAAERSGEHYYIGLHPGVGNPNFKNEKSYSGMNYQDDSGIRLLALFRYWNMIEYFFPYKHLTDKNWNVVLSEFIPLFLNAKTELDYKLTLLRLIAHVNDTHANIYGEKTLEMWKGMNIAPYTVSFIEEKAVVTDIAESGTAQKGGLKAGDVITHINGKTVEAIVEERKPFSPASNQQVQLRNVARDLLRTGENNLSLQIIRDNQPQSYEIACSQNRTSQNTTKPSFRFLTSDIGYIWPETLKNDSISIIMEKFKDTKGIIIDFRCYPRSDFTVFTLGAYLTLQPTDFVKFTNGSIEQPGMFTFSKTLQVGNNNEQCYKGKVVIIVNEQTQSSAEYHTMAFQTAPQAVVIGSATAAADGNVSQIVLPGNVPTMITGIGVYYPDGRETQRIGIALDIEVKPTIKGILKGIDELLEKAIEIINGNQ